MPSSRFALTLLFLASAGCGSSPNRALDAPRIAGWRQIGDIAIGMSRARVEREYGKPLNKPEIVNDTPTSTWEYRGRGVIWADIDESGHVDMLSTSSAAYSTP